MLEAIKKAPTILKFLCAVGLLEILFNSSMPDRVGLNPHAVVPLFGFLVIAVIVWIIFGTRDRDSRSEAAE